MQTIFFPFFFSVFFSSVLNITIALLKYFTKNVITSAIATYFVDILLHTATDATKGHTKGNRQREWRPFLRFHSHELLILFDDVPTGHHTRTTRPVVLGAKADTLLI